MTCTSAKDIWDKQCAQFERSSTQQLNLLMEAFFQAQHDCKEDISMHVAKLQKLFLNLNDELAQHSENTLSEHMLIGRILSTLGKEYDNFKVLWDTIPTSTQTMNFLIEKLCAFELQAGTLASADTTAFTGHKNDKRKLNSMKVNSSKSMKRGADCTKRNFLATSRNNLINGLRSVLKSSSMQGTEAVNQLQRRMLMCCQCM